MVVPAGEIGVLDLDIDPDRTPVPDCRSDRLAIHQRAQEIGIQARRVAQVAVVVTFERREHGRDELDGAQPHVGSQITLNAEPQRRHGVQVPGHRRQACDLRRQALTKKPSQIETGR